MSSLFSKKPCAEPQVFKMDPTICANCGHPLAAHAEKDKTYELPLKKALWRVLLEHGGVWNYYGGHFEKAEKWPGADRVYSKRTGNDMWELKQHLVNCEIDWAQTCMPEIDTNSEFAGTGNESWKIEVVQGTLYCKCKEYGGRWDDKSKVGIQGLTVGQLIWLAVQSGEDVDA